MEYYSSNSEQKKDFVVDFQSLRKQFQEKCPDLHAIKKKIISEFKPPTRRGGGDLKIDTDCVVQEIFQLKEEDFSHVRLKFLITGDKLLQNDPIKTNSYFRIIFDNPTRDTVYGVIFEVLNNTIVGDMRTMVLMDGCREEFRPKHFRQIMKPTAWGVYAVFFVGNEEHTMLKFCSVLPKEKNCY